MATVSNLPTPVAAKAKAVAPKTTGVALGTAPPTIASLRQAMGGQVKNPKNMPIPTIYDAPTSAKIAALYNTMNQTSAGLDLQGSRLGADYETNRSKNLQQQQYDTEQLSNQLADRGLAYSGIRTDQMAKLAQRYTQILQGLAQGRQRGLEDINTRRLQNVGNTNTQVGNVEKGYAAQVQAYLDKQAQTQAAAQQAAAKRVADAAVAKQKQDLATRQTTDLQNQITALQQKVAAPAPAPVYQAPAPVYRPPQPTTYYAPKAPPPPQPSYQAPPPPPQAGTGNNAVGRRTGRQAI